jgi:stage II sporulation protein D
MYGGLDSEATRSNQAVDETRGMMVTYKGNVITAFFHASSGGHTESSENVWGSQVPYLRGVPDFDQASPRFSWERRVGAAKLAELLRVNGYGIGSVKTIELSPLTRQPVVATDRGLSGRVKRIIIKGSVGSVQLSGGQMSSLLGLPSTLIDMELIRDGDHSFVANTQSSRLSFQDPAQDILLIRGKGSGHGIGLSQWGAKAMADKDKTGNNLFYKEILMHYYSGATVLQWYQ